MYYMYNTFKEYVRLLASAGIGLSVSVRGKFDKASIRTHFIGTTIKSITIICNPSLRKGVGVLVECIRCQESIFFYRFLPWDFL